MIYLFLRATASSLWACQIRASTTVASGLSQHNNNTDTLIYAQLLIRHTHTHMRTHAHCFGSEGCQHPVSIQCSLCHLLGSQAGIIGTNHLVKSIYSCLNMFPNQPICHNPSNYVTVPLTVSASCFWGLGGRRELLSQENGGNSTCLPSSKTINYTIKQHENALVDKWPACRSLKNPPMKHWNALKTTASWDFFAKEHVILSGRSLLG